MIKNLLGLFLIFNISMFAADAELDIVKKSTNLPKIVMSVSPNAKILPE